MYQSVGSESICLQTIMSQRKGDRDVSLVFLDHPETQRPLSPSWTVAQTAPQLPLGGREPSDEPFLIPLTFPIENRPRDTICSQILLIPPSGCVYSPSSSQPAWLPSAVRHHSFLDKSVIP